MKTTLRSVLVVAAVLLAAGCSTNKKTEQMLTASGFKLVPATTPEQIAHLQSLPQGKLTKVIKDGGEWVVYPDVKEKILYVGGYDAYKSFLKMRYENDTAQLDLQAAEMDTSWGVWGPWGGPGWY